MRRIFIVILIIGCTPEGDQRQFKNVPDPTQIIIEVLEAWVKDYRFPSDTTRYSTEFEYSAKYHSLDDANISVLPEIILSDSVLLYGDSTLITNRFSSLNQGVDKRGIIIFYFSNFIADSSHTNVAANLSVTYTNNSKTTHRGGHQELVAFIRIDSLWKFTSRNTYIEY